MYYKTVTNVYYYNNNRHLCYYNSNMCINTTITGMCVIITVTYNYVVLNSDMYCVKQQYVYYIIKTVTHSIKTVSCVL